MSKKNWVDTSNIPDMEPLQADSRSLSEGFHRYLRNHLGHFLSCRLYILGIETSYFVKGLFDGTLKTEISDL